MTESKEREVWNGLKERNGQDYEYDLPSDEPTVVKTMKWMFWKYRSSNVTYTCGAVILSTIKSSLMLSRNLLSFFSLC